MKKRSIIYLGVALLILSVICFYYLGNGRLFRKCPSFFEYRNNNGHKSIDCFPGVRGPIEKIYCKKNYIEWMEDNCDVHIGF